MPKQNTPLCKTKSSLQLYLVTDSKLCQSRGLITTVEEAIAGGVTMIQIRDKESSDEDLYHIARKLKHRVDGRVPLLMNDRVEIAQKAGLDGAHIGQTDMNVEQARAILGPDKWLGLTINNSEQLNKAQAEFFNQIDYFGIGPVFSTTTKPDHAHPIGIAGLTQLVAESRLPVVAIGGINIENAQEVCHSNCDGIAVVSAICAAQNIKLACQLLS